MPARPPLHPPSRRLALLMRSQHLTAERLAARARVSVPRLGAALNGATANPHLIAERLGVPVAVVLAVRANPAGSHRLPLRMVAAILDGAPPTGAELTRIARVFGFARADALNDACCPRCATVGGEVTPVLCWRCGWRVRFPQVPPPPDAGEAA